MRIKSDLTNQIITENLHLKQNLLDARKMILLNRILILYYDLTK